MKLRNRRKMVANKLTVNPFVSEAQRRKCWAADDPAWDCHEWSHATEDIKSLPLKVGKARKKAKQKLTANKGKVRDGRGRVGPNKVDPSRTLTLRRWMATQLRKKFGALKGRIYKLVVVEDAFGLVPRQPLSFNSNPEGCNQYTGPGCGGNDPHEKVDVHDPGSGEVYWTGPRHEAERMLKEQEELEPGHGLRIKPAEQGREERESAERRESERRHEEAVKESVRVASLKTGEGLLPGHPDFVDPPDRLYHATFAAKEIGEQGFKSSDELGKQVLGGTSSGRVSFTTKENAEKYADALNVARKAAKGELTDEESVAEAGKFGVDRQAMRRILEGQSHEQDPSRKSFNVWQQVSFTGKQFPLFMGGNWPSHLKDSPPASVVSIESKHAKDITYNPGENEWRVKGLKGVVANEFNPDQQRDEHGKWSSAGAALSAVVGSVKAAGALAAHVEHVVSAYVKDRVGKSVARLPSPLQGVAKGAFVGGKAMAAVAFANWTLGQHLAERVSRERGATEEQARRLRGVLSAIDSKTFEAFKVTALLGVHAAHLPAVVTGTLPAATTAYLCYSTARDPLATVRAATKMVKGWIPEQRLAGNVRNAAIDRVHMLDRSLLAHDYDDWYIALLSAALDHVGSVDGAVTLADSLYRLSPEQPITIPSSQEDDGRDLLGSVVGNRGAGGRNGQQRGDGTTGRGDEQRPQGHGGTLAATVQGPRTPGDDTPQVRNTRWQFATSADKVKAFQDWLRAQVKDTVTSVSDEEMWHRYIETGFRKGAGRSYDDVKKKAAAAGGQDAVDFYKGTRDEFLKDSFAQPVTREKVELLAGRTYDDLEGVTEDMSLRMSRSLADGLVQGKSPLDVAGDLNDDLELGKDRSILIARTEVVRAHAEGQLTALESLGVDEIGVAVEWSSTGDGKVCPQCQPLQGVVLTVDEARGLLPRHPNCVIGDTVIQGQVTAALKSRYAGELVELGTSKGARATLTINHPVLTEHGFIRAGDIQEGQYLVCYIGQPRMPVNADVEQRPTTIQEVFDTLSAFSHQEPVSSFDFYGDEKFMVGQVDVVLANLPLGERLPGKSQDAGQVFLVPPDNGRMGSRGLVKTLTGCHPPPLDGLSLALVPQEDAVSDKPTVNTTAVKTKHLGEAVGRFPRQVQPANLGIVQPPAIPGLCLGLASELDVVLPEPVKQGITLNTDLFCQLIRRFPGKVTADEVVNVRRFHYKGPVYCVETPTGYFTASGGGPSSLLIKNCRCAFTPANVGEDEGDQKRSKPDIDTALKESIDAEVTPKGTGRGKKGMPAKPRESDWAGADLDVDENRPVQEPLPPQVANLADGELLDSFQGLMDNAFCPTGPGGGVDPSCSPGGSASGKSASTWWAEMPLKEKGLLPGVSKGAKLKSYTQLSDKDKAAVDSAHKAAGATTAPTPTPAKVTAPTPAALPHTTKPSSTTVASPQWPHDKFVRGEDYGQDAHQKLQPAFKPLLDKLSANARDAVRDYTDTQYKRVNEALMGGSELKGTVKRVVEGLDEAFQRGKLSKPVLTYRSMGLKAEDADKFYADAESKGKDGTPLRLKGFLSTTVDASQTGRFGGDKEGEKSVHFEIQARHGLYVDDISASHGEKELLLPRDSKYKVVGVKKDIPYRWGGAVQRRDVIQLEQIVG